MGSASSLNGSNSTDVIGLREADAVASFPPPPPPPPPPPQPNPLAPSSAISSRCDQDALSVAMATLGSDDLDSTQLDMFEMRQHSSNTRDPRLEGAQAVSSTEVGTSMTQHEDDEIIYASQVPTPTANPREIANEGSSTKKRALQNPPDYSETESCSRNMEHAPYSESKVKEYINAVFYHAPPRTAISAPLEKPANLFFGDRKMAAIVKNGSSHRYYFIGKVISAKFTPLYYCIHQSIPGLRSSIIRELSTLQNSSPDLFMNNFRWIDHSATNFNHFVLVLLKVSKAFLAGQDMTCVVRKCLSYTVKGLLKDLDVIHNVDLGETPIAAKQQCKKNSH